MKKVAALIAQPGITVHVLPFMTAVLEGRSLFSSFRIIEYVTLCMIKQHIAPFFHRFFYKLALNICMRRKMAQSVLEYFAI